MRQRRKAKLWRLAGYACIAVGLYFLNPGLVVVAAGVWMLDRAKLVNRHG